MSRQLGIKTETTPWQSSGFDLTFQIKMDRDEAAKSKTDPISTPFSRSDKHERFSYLARTCPSLRHLTRQVT